MSDAMQKELSRVGSWKMYFYFRKERATRYQWWLVWGLGVVLNKLSDFVPDDAHVIFAIPLIAISLASIWASFVITFKRCYDLNRRYLMSIWFGALLLLVILLAAAANPSLLIGMVIPVSAAAIILALTGIVFWGFIRGTKGPNKHGPDPLEKN